MNKRQLADLHHQVYITQPGTLAQLIDETRSFVGDKYEVAVKPVYCFGYLQGYKVQVTWIEGGKARSVTCPRGAVYSVFK